MSVTERWSRTATDLRERWARHRQTFLWLSVVSMSVFSAYRLTQAVMELLAGRKVGDTTNIFHLLIHRWFASMPVYSESPLAVHLPATYLILWPFFGWLEITAARWLWLATIGAALVWLAYLIVRESGADTAVERAFVALLLLSSYGTALTVRNGQLGLHVLVLLLAGLLLLRWRPGWRRDLLSAALLLLTLVKPTISVPFMWIALFLPGGLRPTALITLGYVALSLFAVSYQSVGLFTLLRDWETRSSGLAVSAGSSNLHIWLVLIGLENWILPTSLLALVGLGLWIYRHRHVDFWIVIAVSAMVARFWTYHRQYDDLLILLPEVALFRLAKRGPSEGGTDVVAAALLALTAVGMLTPLRLPRFPEDWRLPVVGVNTIVWIAVLVFLLKQAGRGRYSSLT